MARVKCPRGMKAVSVCVPEVQQGPAPRTARALRGITGNVLTQPATKWADSGKNEGGHWVMDPTKGTGTLALVGSTFQLSFDGELLKTYESYADLLKHTDKSGQLHTADPGRFWSHEPSIQFSNMGEVMGWFDQMLEAGQIGRLSGLSGLGTARVVGDLSQLVALRECAHTGKMMSSRVMARVELLLPTERSRVHRAPILIFYARPPSERPMHFPGAVAAIPAAPKMYSYVSLPDADKPFVLLYDMEMQPRQRRPRSHNAWRVEDPAALMVLVDAAMEKTGGSFSGLVGRKDAYRTGIDGVGPYFEVDASSAQWRSVYAGYSSAWDAPTGGLRIRAMASRDGWKQKNILRVNLETKQGPISCDVNLNTAKEGLAHHDGFEGRTTSWAQRAPIICLKFSGTVSGAMQVWLDQLETDRGFSDVAHGAPLLAGLGAGGLKVIAAGPQFKVLVDSYRGPDATRMGSQYHMAQWRRVSVRGIEMNALYLVDLLSFPFITERALVRQPSSGNMHRSTYGDTDRIAYRIALEHKETRELIEVMRDQFISEEAPSDLGGLKLKGPRLHGLGAERTVDGNLLQLTSDDLEVKLATVVANRRGNRTTGRMHIDHFNVVASSDRDTLHFFAALTQVDRPDKQYHSYPIEISSKQALEGMERQQGFGTEHLIHIPVMLNKQGKEALSIWLDEQRERGRLTPP